MSLFFKVCFGKSRVPLPHARIPPANPPEAAASARQEARGSPCRSSPHARVHRFGQRRCVQRQSSYPVPLARASRRYLAPESDLHLVDARSPCLATEPPSRRNRARHRGSAHDGRHGGVTTAEDGDVSREDRGATSARHPNPPLPSSKLSMTRPREEAREKSIFLDCKPTNRVRAAAFEGERCLAVCVQRQTQLPLFLARLDQDDTFAPRRGATGLGKVSHCVLVSTGTFPRTSPSTATPGGGAASRHTRSSTVIRSWGLPPLPCSKSNQAQSAGLRWVSHDASAPRGQQGGADSGRGRERGAN